jgi:hypothetical protein
MSINADRFVKWAELKLGTEKDVAIITQNSITACYLEITTIEKKTTW